MSKKTSNYIYGPYAKLLQSEVCLFLLKGFTPPEIKCRNPLGIESGKIPSTAIVASTMYNQYYGPDRSRLRTVREGSYGGGWAAQYRDANQFLQFDLGKVAMVTAIATQGRSDANWMVTSYTLAYSLDAGSFTHYGDEDGQVKTLFLYDLIHLSDTNYGGANYAITNSLILTLNV